VVEYAAEQMPGLARLNDRLSTRFSKWNIDRTSLLNVLQNLRFAYLYRNGVLAFNPESSKEIIELLDWGVVPLTDLVAFGEKVRGEALIVEPLRVKALEEALTLEDGRNSMEEHLLDDMWKKGWLDYGGPVFDFLVGYAVATVLQDEGRRRALFLRIVHPDAGLNIENEERNA
jgi:hypothetical protein